MSQNTLRTDEYFSEDYSDRISLVIEFCRNFEQELNDWKKKYRELDKSLMCELRDPCGTIWEHAKKLQDENDAFKKELAEARKDTELLNWLDSGDNTIWKWHFVEHPDGAKFLCRNKWSGKERVREAIIEAMK